ncbi:MAG: adenylate/guanylate cyclase domain-containing protein [Alphaproteobacteria bacterium]|nr:adenylate/guanylate cyclase domain-containing protein [Alphaproteobacteria bacterium]
MRWLVRRTWSASPENPRLAQAFRSEERAGFMLAALVRTAIILAAALWIAVTSNYRGGAYAFTVGEALVLAAVGVVQFDLARRRINPPWLKYFWAILDCALLTLLIIARNPFVEGGPPPSTVLRESLILLYLVFLVQAAFTFSPRLVAWCGLCIIAGWTAILFWVIAKPGVFYDLGLPDESGIRAYAARYANPFYFPLSKWMIEIFAVALLTFGLSIAVARSRRLVAQATHAERARSNLARHFSPNMVETLSLSDQPFDRVRRQNAAVLFADIRDFTRFAENADPDDVVELLRAFHALLQNQVFEAQGTLDKVMGDGLMATFGVPVASSADAARALRCARGMLAALDEWNEQRRSIGLDSIRIGIGIHYGPVVAGNVGSEQRLAFEVIGDTVNTASRLQSLSKDLGVRLTISADAYTAARREIGETNVLLTEGFTAHGDIQLRGRETSIGVYSLT